ncbi:MAG TPA: hypothetical protein VGQ64_05100 [Candidatus Limnocylindrales bacterium]|nr:hypothetical protein [Candidatus Limnocylindrales bacterium]
MPMIPNAIIHIQNEQPLLADLYEMPTGLDQGLLCTNLRMLDGKKPIFIDRADSVFFFPYLHIRFVEILSARSGLPEIEAQAAATPTEAAEEAESEADLELDEDFLRRIREV